jgi:hypothetical protein
MSSLKSTECVFIAISNATGFPMASSAGFTSTVTLPPELLSVSKVGSDAAPASELFGVFKGGAVGVLAALVGAGVLVGDGVGALLQAASKSTNRASNPANEIHLFVILLAPNL